MSRCFNRLVGVALSSIVLITACGDDELDSAVADQAPEATSTFPTTVTTLTTTLAPTTTTVSVTTTTTTVPPTTTTGTVPPTTTTTKAHIPTSFPDEGSLLAGWNASSERTFGALDATRVIEAGLIPTSNDLGGDAATSQPAGPPNNAYTWTIPGTAEVLFDVTPDGALTGVIVTNTSDLSNLALLWAMYTGASLISPETPLDQIILGVTQALVRSPDGVPLGDGLTLAVVQRAEGVTLIAGRFEA